MEVVPKSYYSDPIATTSIKSEDNFIPKSESSSLQLILKDENLLMPKCEIIVKSEDSYSSCDPEPPETDTSTDEQDDPLSTEGNESKTCPLCSRSFQRPSAVARHMLTHTGELPFACSAPECGKRFNREANLKRHVKLSHASKSLPQFKCSYASCGKTFSIKQNLSRHERTTHTGEKRAECECCGKKFRDTAQLKDHLRSHTGERPFECEICLKKFSSNSHLVKHRKLHTEEKPYKCEKCDKRFDRVKELEYHNNIHLGIKPFKCSECSKSFHSLFRRNRHKKLHAEPHEQSVVITGI